MTQYERIRKALKTAKLLDYTNGMATESVDLETKLGDISIIRKAPHPETPEHFLIRIKPNRELGHIEPNRIAIAKKIKRMSILADTDVNIEFKRHGSGDMYTHSAIVPVKIFNFL